MKQLFIMRGLSGSGKSTVAQILKVGLINSKSNGVKILSADDLRYVDGVYTFNSETEPYIWEEFERLFHEAIKDNIESIIIDNTNLKFSAFEDYKQIAVNCGYIVHEIIVGDFDVKKCIERNKHDVPPIMIDKMLQVFEFKRLTQ